MYISFYANWICTYTKTIGVILVPVSEKRKASMYAYAKSKLKRIPLDVQKDYYEVIKAKADAAGEKVNEYIKNAVAQRIERESSD